MKKNPLKEKIKTYESFIKENKVPTNNDFYQEEIDKAKEYLNLIKTRKLTPQIFDTINDRDKWDISKLLRNIIWVCKHCGSFQGEEKPTHTWEERYCSECENILTKRTGGGMSDPFNYSFIRKNKNELPIITVDQPNFNESKENTNHRKQIDQKIISKALKEIGDKTNYRLGEKGFGTFASRHEFLGVMTEEFYELVEAIKSNNFESTKNALLDLAVTCHFAIACINSKTLDW